MNMMHWAENGRLNDWIVRFGIRRLLRKRLQEESAQVQRRQAWRDALGEQPITLAVDEANRQHYEVPAQFFRTVLGPHLKYSCCLWSDPEHFLNETLESAEHRALAVTCERAQLQDGQRILEVGCGWGSLTLWMGERYPNSQIVAVSNSASQRRFILDECSTRGIENVTVVTKDIADYEAEHSSFDRVVSVEMFEHVRNHRALTDRISQWLKADGKLFVHIFCHRDFAYPFDDRGQDDWMARQFFTGGMMPSFGLLPAVASSFDLAAKWRIPGQHYQATSEAWLQRLDDQRDEIESILADAPDPQVQTQRWRMFFMACAELFGYDKGSQWQVAHYLFEQNA